MTKEFKDRLLHDGCVDTRKYRYVTKEFPDRLEIRRIPLDKLDTTAALTDWETVEVIRS